MGISIWQLLIVLVIVLLLFGTRKLRNLGSDLGGAIRGFKEAMSGSEEEVGQQNQTGQLEEGGKGEHSSGGQVKTDKRDIPEREEL